MRLMAPEGTFALHPSRPFASLSSAWPLLLRPAASERARPEFLPGAPTRFDDGEWAAKQNAAPVLVDEERQVCVWHAHEVALKPGPRRPEHQSPVSKPRPSNRGDLALFESLASPTPGQVHRTGKKHDTRDFCIGTAVQDASNHGCLNGSTMLKPV